MDGWPFFVGFLMIALFYNHTGRASGAERVLMLALKHLDRTLVSPCVVCPPGELADKVQELGIPVNPIKELNARITLWPHKLATYATSLIQTVLALRSEVKRSKADIVHANSPRAGIAAVFATVGMSMPVVWHVHDEFTPHPITGLIRWLALVCDRCTVISVSEATAKSFVGSSAKLNERVRVIHNAVDLKEIDGWTVSQSIRDELGLGSDHFLFGIVGQITPRKGQLELVRAFAQFSENVPSARLLVVGAPMFGHDNAYFEDLIRTTSSLGLTDRVLFLGHRTDVIDIIKQLDILVINSRSEAFVMVGSEAMACQTPVIATDVGGTREMVEDGFNGLLIPNGDAGALVSALAKIFGDQEMRNNFVKRSRSRVEKEFNIDRFASDFHDTLFAAISARTTGAVPLDRSLRRIENP